MYQIVKTLLNNQTYALLISLMCSFLWDTFYWLSLPYANGFGILGLLFSLLFWILYLKSAKMSMFLPLLVTVAGILAYPLTGFYVAVIAIMSISIKRTGVRWNVVVICLLSSLFLPLFDIIVRLANFTISGLIIPFPNFLSIDALLNALFFLSQRSFSLNGFSLNTLLDIPYLIVYLLAGIGIIVGRLQVKREIYYLLLTLLISAFLAEAYGWLVQERIYHRVGATILPWLLLIFASMSFKWVHTRIIEIIPTFRLSLQRAAALPRKYSIEKRKLFAVSICIMAGVASTANFIFFPTANNYNVSVDLVNAVNYVITQDPSKDSLILTDLYTVRLFSAFAHGSWYNYPYGGHADELFLTIPMFEQALKEPSNVMSAVEEGKASVTNLLSKLNMTYNPTRFYLIYDSVLTQYFYGSADVQRDIVEPLSSAIGDPKVFGTIFVFSGPISKYGTVTRIDRNTMRYDLAFSDLKSIVEGNIKYDPVWDGVLSFNQNSTLTIKIDTERRIINASLSCSIYQYEEYNSNLIQVSVDRQNWVNVWKANTTADYADLNSLDLPSSLSGQNSFFLRFYSENVNDTSAYSMAIRTLWGNADNGIKLRIFTGV
jgi:hypothetical protein